VSVTASITIEDLEVSSDRLDPERAAAIYREHGALVVRGLMKPYAAQISADCDAAAAEAVGLLDQAKVVKEGWMTPDGTLWLPAPKGFSRDKQIMVLACQYQTSAALFRSAWDERLLDIVGRILGPDVELFMDGQVLYKEPVGGHAKNLHQDAAYFQHRHEGPVAVLSYAVDTDLNNGALHVIPGTHRLGVLKHVDTSSHLGLDEKEWSWDRAVPVIGRAGDAIFFAVNTVHGSKSNFSKTARPAFIHRYRRADDYVVVSATTTENRALAEKRAEEAKKENQRGVMVRGRRKFEPSRA
jgi:phytanoyl-CoA hydroxylase